MDLKDMKAKALTICGDFLGGPWQEVSLEELRFSKMSGGLSNSLYLCSLPEDSPGYPREVVLRIYGGIALQEGRADLVAAEAVTFVMLSERGLGPKLYGLFPEGRLEQYIPSHYLSNEEMRTYSCAIARQMAKIHVLEVPARKTPDILLNFVIKWLGESAKVLKNGGESFSMSYDEYEKEVEWIKERFYPPEMNLSRDINPSEFSCYISSSEISCYINSSKISRKSNLQPLVLSKDDSKPFKCNTCDKEFAHKAYLRRHLYLHTGEKPYNCEECRMSFATRTGWRRHTVTHTSEKPFTCDVCQKTFSIKKYLKQHMQRHTGEKPFACEKCPKVFVSKFELLTHDQSHTGKKYTCEVCEKKFTGKNYLRVHLRVHTGEKPFQCEICEKRFSSKSTLQAHLATHSEKKTFSCDVCETTYYRKSSLHAHLRVHIGEKRPFACETCQKKFSYKLSLLRHLKLHTSVISSAEDSSQNVSS